VLEEPLGDDLPQERIKELNIICNFARINYVFKASQKKKKSNSKKK